MKVKVYYHASFSDITGREEEILQAECLNLEELFHNLRTRYGKEFQELLFDQKSGNISPGVVVFVNSLLTSPHTLLKDGDEVAFLMPLAGG